MSVERENKKMVNLNPLELKIKQSKDMTLFTIIDSQLVNVTHPTAGLQMKLRIKRKIMSEMMTTFFPSFLLMMITYATTFFKPFFFEAALSVNLTTMLVMTTIFISKMESLPLTSTTKMIDYWLILCQLVPFVQVVLLTAKEYLRDEEQVKEEPEESDETEEGEEPGKKEAWKLPDENRFITVTVPMLLLIGRLEFLFKFKS